MRAAEAFEAHCEAWNAGDRTSWLALFAPDVTLDDPVGVPTKHGLAALETTWATSHRPDRSWRLEPRRVIECGSEVAVDLVNVGTLAGATVTLSSIEIWRVNDRGLIDAVRSYFIPDGEVNDPFYVPGPPSGAALDE